MPTSDNSFAALQLKERRKKEKKPLRNVDPEIVVKPVESQTPAVPTNTNGGDLPVLTSWADQDDDDEEEEHYFPDDVHRDVEQSCSDTSSMTESETDESQDEQDGLDYSTTSTTVYTCIDEKEVNKTAAPQRNLSKKELKAKEIEELGALLAELGLSELTEECPTAEQPAPNQISTSKKKKKKPKKTNDSEVVDEPTEHVKENESTAVKVNPTVTKEQALEALKLRQRQTKKSGQSKGAAAAQATVRAEVKKRQDAKKVKPKKSERHLPYQG